MQLTPRASAQIPMRISTAYCGKQQEYSYHKAPLIGKQKSRNILTAYCIWAESVFKRKADLIYQFFLPGRDNVRWVQRNRVEMVGLIDPELVAGAINIITLTYRKIGTKKSVEFQVVGKFASFCFKKACGFSLLCAAMCKRGIGGRK